MIYVISDLHGYPLSDFKALLKSADFSDDDYLYILGDVVDRNGDGGIEMLTWLLNQWNVQLILGNHEAMLLSCDFITKSVDDFCDGNSMEKADLYLNYMQNGGDVTVEAIRKLMKKSPKTVNDIFDYLREAPLYEAVTMGDRDYLLVHSGLDNFSHEKKMSEYTSDELLWAWPEPDVKYFDDIITVFGHTPTVTFGEEHKGKIIKTDTWIDIDVGAAYGIKPVLLRLDDMKEFRLGE